MNRMSDDIFECFRAGVKEAADSDTYAHDTISALFNEASRARRVEAEQSDQLRQKEEALISAYITPELLAWRAESPHGFSRVYAADAGQAEERGALAQRCRVEQVAVSRWPEEDLCKAAQKDETFRELVDALEHMTHIATGLHAIYRRRATVESDGSLERAFAEALALVKKARKP